MENNHPQQDKEPFYNENDQRNSFNSHNDNDFEPKSDFLGEPKAGQQLFESPERPQRKNKADYPGTNKKTKRYSKEISEEVILDVKKNLKF